MIWVSLIALKSLICKFSHLYKIVKGGDISMNEAMALASISPMVGVSGPHHGGYIMNMTNYDKDLRDGKNPYEFIGFSKTLDMDDEICGLDPYGKMCVKNKSELFNGKNVVVEVYGICKNNVDKEYKDILKECNSKRRHKKSYLYEVFSGKKCYTDDQIRYDPLFESIDLEKISNAIQGVSQSMMGRVKQLYTQQNDSRYIPDNDFPQRTDKISDLNEEYSEENLYILEDLSYRKFNNTGSRTLYGLVDRKV